jgi:hypothetical protein
MTARLAADEEEGALKILTLSNERGAAQAYGRANPSPPRLLTVVSV